MLVSIIAAVLISVSIPLSAYVGMKIGRYRLDHNYDVPRASSAIIDRRIR